MVDFNVCFIDTIYSQNVNTKIAMNITIIDTKE